MLVIAQGDSCSVCFKFLGWFHPQILASLMDTRISKKYAKFAYESNFFVDPFYQLTQI